ncbi:ADP-ribose pyrophosphatase [Lasiosphaeria ovina]|uniref:ADP-ribose pyrophosphatase n=1 Tax=Lasiosphaeria ovina TaxID=92902 RepID=A0AAE0TYE5_9PEZI|nr:ADP-ribose pyrophosphatase [Lasiosphaeria ovina]
MSSSTGSKVISVKPLPPRLSKTCILTIDTHRIEYEGPDGKLRTWEAMQRTTRPKDSPVDAVTIVAIRNESAAVGPEVLLEKQFRPPAGAVVVEFPAGLMDAGETTDECAARELREETGYVGDIVPDVAGARPVFFGCEWQTPPASSSSRTVVINVRVDLGRAENQNPTPQLEADEFIVPFWVPVKSLHAECRKLHDEGFAIDSKVGIFAEGIEVAKLWQPAL